MPRVPEYTSDVQLRPAFGSEFTVRANADHFGAGIGRGMEALAQGVSNVGDAIANAKALEDETIARDARNKYLTDADDAMYGETGFMNTAGKVALDEFPALTRRIEQIRKDHSGKLTPPQQAIFNKAVDADELNRKRTAIMHRGAESKKFTIQTHEAGAANFLTEAVRSYRDAAKSRKYLAAAHSETANLGDLQGLAPDLIKLKQDAINDDYFSRVALDMVQSDPVSAVDFVQKNIQRMSPDAANRLLVDLAKPLGTAAGRDAVATGPAHVSADVKSRQQRAMSFYMANGMTKEQASGIVGNLMAESNLLPSAVGDQGTAHGLAQHRGERLTKLKRFAASQGKSWQDFDVQLAFVLVELRDDETDAYRALLSAKTVDEATAAFIGFERPKGWSKANPRGGHNFSGRLRYAQQAAGMDVKAGDVVSGSDASAGPSLPQFSDRTEAVISGLPAYLQSQVREIAAGEVKQTQAALAAEYKAAQTATVDNYRLRIETADNTLTIPEILADPVLDDGDRATLVSRFNEKNGDLIEAQRNVALFNSGQLRVDPYDAAGKKAVDGVWGQMVAAAGDQPERAVASLPTLVAQTGVVPERPFNLIRGAIASSDFGQMIEGLNLATLLIDADKAAVLRRDGGAAISDAVSAYKHWVGTMGLTSEAAAQRILEARDPEKIKLRAALVESKVAKDWFDKQATSANIAKLFPEGGGWLSNAALGDNPVQEAAMTREYRDFLEDALHQAGGDYDAAVAIAGEAFKRLYGMTAFSLSGDEVISRLPVERTYRPDAEGGYGYVRQQAKDLLKREGIAASDVFLISDDLTERDVVAGKNARYRVFYADEAGALEEFNRPMSFTEPSPAEVATAKRKASVERLRQNRADLERSRDREGNLDRFLEGDPLTGQLPQQGPPLSARPVKPVPGGDLAPALEATPWGAM